MSNTYTWVIESLDCYPQADGQQDVVFNVNWRINGVSSETKTIQVDADTSYVVYFKGTVYGSQPLTYTAKTPYTPYNQLTQDQVIDWVKSAMGEERVTELLLNIDKQINDELNPPVTTPPLPWTA
jgi:hypothetical protein